MIKKWETLEEKKIGNFKIFDLAWIKRRHPEMNKESEFVVLDSAEWVNIIPITIDRKVLLIEQYRHGIDEVTLEVPGGLVEEEENPVDAAERECVEETGYKGKGRALLIGENIPNPAFQTNRCYSYVWFDCKKVTEQKLDRHEDIRIIETPLENIREMILEGNISHSLVLTAFFFYLLHYSDL